MPRQRWLMQRRRYAHPAATRANNAAYVGNGATPPPMCCQSQQERPRCSWAGWCLGRCAGRSREAPTAGLCWAPAPPFQLPASTTHQREPHQLRWLHYLLTAMRGNHQPTEPPGYRWQTPRRGLRPRRSGAPATLADAAPPLCQPSGHQSQQRSLCG